MKHKHADLIKAYADDESVRFVLTEYSSKGEQVSYDHIITEVIHYPDYNWKIQQPFKRVVERETW